MSHVLVMEIWAHYCTQLTQCAEEITYFASGLVNLAFNHTDNRKETVVLRIVHL